MKSTILTLVFILSFALNAESHSPAPVDVSSLPEPLPDSAGELIYQEMGCPMCHGYQGEGDGFMAGGLNPKPRNFTDLKVMGRISDMSMYSAIKHGIPGTAMPSWGLTDEQIYDVISYIKTFLADSQMTVAVCMNEHRKVSLASLKLEGDYKLDVDRNELLKVSYDDNMILLEPRDIKVRNYFSETQQRLVRTHVTVSDRNPDGPKAVIAVRISDCVKWR